DAPLAERLMRVVWPVLWILPAIIGAAAIAWRIAGRDAAVVTLLLAVVGLPAFQQFLPGRIDHHNIQITLAVATVAATVWSDRARGAAWAAGALTGLALAIGLESIAFLALCGAAFGLRYVIDRDGAGSLARYGAALAAGTVAAFLVSVGPDHWGRPVCDTLAINWALPLAAAGLLSGLAGLAIASERRLVRGATVVAIAGVAAATFVLIEPRCLAGPYAMMDPTLRAIWFSYVSEMQSVWLLWSNSPTVAAAIVAFPAAAVVATLVLARERARRRDFGFLVSAGALAVAGALTLGVGKMCMYAIWLGMPLVAAASLRLFARLRLENLAARAFAGMLLTPAVLSAGAIAAVQAAGYPAAKDDDDRILGGCFNTANYAQLARLPQGVVAAEVDIGSFVLALTPHAALAAPYHRLSEGIIAAHRILALPPESARGVVARFGVTYVVTCGARVPPGMGDAERAASLWGRLQAGTVPEWLTAVPAQPGEVFTVYRVTGN
ncbi:MAG TPA: hypothetical protein VH249_24475, partial [Xanthobacteraceae bacterium]|nr:hypothetical protein [Xanthobacteraceae bacterium]